MTDSPAKTTRKTATLDTSVVAGLSFFAGQNRTKKHKAAILLAEDDLSDEAIAAELKIARSTLSEWKTEPEFAQVIGDYQGRIIAQALKLPIAKRHERIRQLNDLNDTYWQIKRERATRYAAEVADTPESAMRGVFGDSTPAEAATGMLVRQPKIAASGKTVVEWQFDKALDSAIKETHKQAAQELGQWSEKSEVTTDGGLLVEIVGIADEDMP